MICVYRKATLPDDHGLCSRSQASIVQSAETRRSPAVKVEDSAATTAVVASQSLSHSLKDGIHEPRQSVKKPPMIPDKATVEGAHVPVADGAPAGVNIGVKIEADEVRNGTDKLGQSLTYIVLKLRSCLDLRISKCVAASNIDPLQKTSGSDHLHTFRWFHLYKQPFRVW